MTNTGRTNDRYILWGAPQSLYTAKVRSYLIKKGLPYRECFPSDDVFNTHEDKRSPQFRRYFCLPQ